MDDSQKWPDLEGDINEPTMTEEEEKKHKERQAQKLQIILERSDIALDGNRRLLEKMRREMGTRKFDDENWAFHLRLQNATPNTKKDYFPRGSTPAADGDLKRPQPGFGTEQGNDVVSSPSQCASDASEASLESD